jgi:hypothetical protein
MLNNKLSILGFALVLLVVGFSRAQVISSSQIKDPYLRSLQVQYNSQLIDLGEDILSLQFDYPFYLSSRLDLELAQQQKEVQRSLRFERYEERTVLAITGNYFAAYSEDKMTGQSRAEQSFRRVVLPILKAAVLHFRANSDLDGYAVEISHHVIGSSMGVEVEKPENFMIFLPQSEATRLVMSSDSNAQQSALLNGKTFLNGEPILLSLNGEVAPPRVDLPGTAAKYSVIANARYTPSRDNSSKSPSDVPVPLEKLEATWHETIAQLIKDLNDQARFVAYAPQTFIVFRQSTYLELSLNTDLPAASKGSRYKIAANAFDEHIAHLIRPVAGYFAKNPDFDGISFSTTVKTGTETESDGSSEAVEFFFPFPQLRCYLKYDCTGQQLIDSGTVLIDGERVSLDLQAAERF